VAVFDAQFKIDVFHVLMNGADADAQDRGDFGIGLAVDNPA
jgi:hypothetical protein